MKKQQLQEMKKIDIKSLKENTKKLKLEIASLYLDKNMSKITNLRVIKNKRRDLAQNLTILGQKILVAKEENNG